MQKQQWIKATRTEKLCNLNADNERRMVTVMICEGYSLLEIDDRQ